MFCIAGVIDVGLTLLMACEGIPLVDGVVVVVVVIEGVDEEARGGIDLADWGSSPME